MCFQQFLARRKNILLLGDVAPCAESCYIDLVDLSQVTGWENMALPRVFKAYNMWRVCPVGVKMLCGRREGFRNI